MLQLTSYLATTNRSLLGKDSHQTSDSYNSWFLSNETIDLDIRIDLWINLGLFLVNHKHENNNKTSPEKPTRLTLFFVLTAVRPPWGITFLFLCARRLPRLHTSHHYVTITISNCQTLQHVDKLLLANYLSSKLLGLDTLTIASLFTHN